MLALFRTTSESGPARRRDRLPPPVIGAFAPRRAKDFDNRTRPARGTVSATLRVQYGKVVSPLSDGLHVDVVSPAHGSLATRQGVSQRYLVPAGIIAGTIGFALINMGWVGYLRRRGRLIPLKVGDFGLVSFHLFSFAFGIIGLGCFSRHTKGRSLTLIKGALWIDLLFWMFYGLQATVGFGITDLYARLTGSDLTSATGFLAGFGFAFGPGQALAVGMSWQNDYGPPDCVPM